MARSEMPNPLKPIVNRVFRSVGLEVRPYRAVRDADFRRSRILAGCEVSVVLDVGANAGQYGIELRHAGYAGRIVSFEPIADAFGRLAANAASDKHWTCLKVALGSDDCESEINVSQNLVSSSLIPMLELHQKAAPASTYVRKEKIQVCRLDSISPEFLSPLDRVFLKLDVQGYEREVLLAAGETLSRVFCIECELSLAPLYEGQSLIREMIEFLDRLGFEMVSIENGFTDVKTGHVLQIDGIFVRKG